MINLCVQRARRNLLPAALTTLGFLLLLLGLLTPAPVAAQPSPEDKVDSLRWAAMKWYKEGNGELANWRDSLYICIHGEEDDGSGVTVEVGDGEGISVTTPGFVDIFIPGRGYTVVWQGKDDDDGPTYDVGIVGFTEALDPQDNQGPGIAVTAGFPELDNDSFSITVWIDDEMVTDTVITDPGPSPNPGPFPWPEFPEIAWVDTDTVPTELCDKHLLSNSDGVGLGPQAERAPGMLGGVTYELTIAEPLPFKIAGGGGTAHVGNRLTITPVNTVKTPKYITSARVVPRNMMEGILVDASLVKFGHEVYGEGEALMEAFNDTLLVSQIGSSGLDGVCIDLPASPSGLNIGLNPIALQNGDQLSWVLNGSVDHTLLNHIYMDSLLYVKAVFSNGRTRFTFDADDETGWTQYQVQFVVNGNIVRERTIDDGGSVAISGIQITGVGKATMAENGFDGFVIGILRNGVNASMRIIPDADNVDSVLLRSSAFLAATQRDDFEIGLTGIEELIDGARPQQEAGASAALSEAPPLKASATPRLLGNHPEPFNPTTTISYALPEAMHVRLEVFDLTGRRVALLVDGAQVPGEHRARFDASRLASGVYLYRMQAGRHSVSRPMLLLK